MEKTIFEKLPITGVNYADSNKMFKHIYKRRAIFLQSFVVQVSANFEIALEFLSENEIV